MSCGATPAKLRPFFQRSHFGFFFPCMFRSGYEEPFCKFSRHFIFRQLVKRGCLGAEQKPTTAVVKPAGG
ncbi:hypothetical protein HanRHA438_Chr15g0732761 [Helianthus annuus]|uniref:Uncharacterized protein n=1 Tax=Helianthus annuus TaxID=4232 RepID=A0A251SC13_HELAN|nr:hypothetical protein HanXRQr2_Chr15g0720251 [Helianthus annuus]KAJ0453182.1 hypothetical protein HanHA300_Chr15g0587441 [Helianthus annuus]KAJ0475100.1 hypothetical protein HanHA89_Chr15g0637261 [Helianthus annuus]KAJ0650655.1 hypothetical protein HanLR1_Chr15g0598171 [Helianthus annuus]KAJ0833481.1 hypothetical protein HanPSC8_Chr15g0690841 [Helianthus annuus]